MAKYNEIKVKCSINIRNSAERSIKTKEIKIIKYKDNFIILKYYLNL